MLQDLVTIVEHIYGHGPVYEMALDQMFLVMLQNPTVVMVSSVAEHDILELNNVISEVKMDQVQLVVLVAKLLLIVVEMEASDIVLIFG